MKNLLSENLPQKVIDFINLSVELLDNDICTLHDLQNIFIYKDEILEAESNRKKRLEMKNWKTYVPKGVNREIWTVVEREV
jgi:hypothetical protein